MTSNRISKRLRTVACLALVGVLTTASSQEGCGGAAGPAPRPRAKAWDVRGNYAITYDDQLTLTLNIGGVETRRTAHGTTEVVDFGSYNGQPVTLDLAEFCHRPDVTCPSEVFPAQVAVDQTDADREQDYYSMQVIDDDPHVLPAGQHAERKDAILHHADWDRFLVGLGSDSGSSGQCGALAISLAGGRFTREGEHDADVVKYRTASGAACTPTDGGMSADGGADDCQAVTVSELQIDRQAPVSGIAEGKVALGWLGGCAFGPFLALASLTIETGYSGTWIGPLDPPAFVPLPDAGTPAADGGTR